MRERAREWSRFAAMLVTVLVAVAPNGGWRLSGALAQESATPPVARNMERVGQVGGSTDVVAVRGSYAYIGQGARVVVMDVSDPAHPRPVASTVNLADDVEQITLAGEYAYVHTSSDAPLKSAVRIFRISDPTHLEEFGQYAIDESRIFGLAMAGTFGYVQLSPPSRGADLIDFSDPASPKTIARSVLPGGNLVVVGQYGYLVGSGRFQVYDLSDPLQPAPVGATEYRETVKDVKADGGYVYIVTNDKHLLDIVDVTDPTSPRRASQTSFARSMADGIQVVGDRAYLTSRYFQQLLVVDLTDRTKPATLGMTTTGFGPPQQAAIGGSFAYVAAASGGFRVMSIADASRPVEVGSYDVPAEPTGTTSVAYAGGYAYVSDGYNGLHAVRVDDPARPAEAGFYRGAGEAGRVVLSGQYAYLLERAVSDPPHFLRVLDLHDPAHPTLVGSLDLAIRGDDLAVAGSTVYVTTGDDLHVVDVSDPAHPREVGTYAPPLDPSLQNVNLGGEWSRITLTGQYAVLASVVRTEGTRGGGPAPAPAGSGLRVIDVSNPAAPVEVGFTRVLWDPDVAAMVGSYLYVVADQMDTNPGRGLRVFDLSDPAHPAESTFLPIGAASFGGSISLSGHYAYVATLGVHVLDVADPAHPVEVGFLPGDAHSVVADGNTAYIGAGSDGLVVARFTGGG